MTPSALFLGYARSHVKNTLASYSQIPGQCSLI